jgi:hypothetical protein
MHSVISAFATTAEPTTKMSFPAPPVKVDANVLVVIVSAIPAVAAVMLASLIFSLPVAAEP